MSLTWFVECAQRADEIDKQRKDEFNANVIRPPEPGSEVQVSIRVDSPPPERTIVSEKKNGKKFVIHCYTAIDGRVFECFDSLHFAIARALAKREEKILSDNLTHVLLHIQNVGEGKKDKWAVIPLIGV